MRKTSNWRNYGLLLLLVAASIFGGNSLSAQSEAQAADEEMQYPAGHQQERRPSRRLPSHQRRAKESLITSLAPTDQEIRSQASNLSRLILPKVYSKPSKHGLRGIHDMSVGTMLVIAGAVTLGVSLLVLILAFVSITAPIFLVLLLFLLIFFGITGVVGLGLIIAGIIYGLTEDAKPVETEEKKDENPEPEKIKSEEIK